MMMPTTRFLSVIFAAMALCLTTAEGQERLRVAVAGLSHDHAHSLLRAYRQQEVDIVGIAEPDSDVVRRYRQQYQLADSLFYPNVADMLRAVRPDAVLAYNAIAEHVDVAEACLPLRIPLMVEKPLAINNTQANRIAQLSRQYATPVFTNYETTWYPSNQTVKQRVVRGEVGKLKKVIVKDGHQGPKEIGCSEAFLDWLTDPDKNGGGALVDFGCYGANLMTWLMDGERPVAVTAVTQQLKPLVYPHVDDDATIILEYAGGTTAVIQASWDWPYSIKDLHVYGDKVSLHAVDANTVVEYAGPKKSVDIPVAAGYFSDHISYLKAVLNGESSGQDDLSSLANNLIVVEILQAARESAQRGGRILLDSAR